MRFLGSRKQRRGEGPSQRIVTLLSTFAPASNFRMKTLLAVCTWPKGISSLCTFSLARSVFNIMFLADAVRIYPNNDKCERQEAVFTRENMEYLEQAP